MAERGNPLRILIVDDHAVVRKGLQAVLGDEEGLEVIGEASSGDESVDKARVWGGNIPSVSGEGGG